MLTRGPRHSIGRFTRKRELLMSSVGRRRRRSAVAFCCLASAAACLFVAQPASGVILSRTSTRNTAAPTGTNANSGWQYQGNWGGGFHGTPIGKSHFITAEHLGGAVGQNIFYQGKNYM